MFANNLINVGFFICFNKINNEKQLFKMINYFFYLFQHMRLYRTEIIPN